MSAVYRSDKTVKMWKIPRLCNTFWQKFDHINQQVHGLSCMDDLLRGKQISRLLLLLCDIAHAQTYSHVYLSEVLNTCLELYRNAEQVKGTDYTGCCYPACSLQY